LGVGRGTTKWQNIPPMARLGRPGRRKSALSASNFRQTQTGFASFKIQEIARRLSWGAGGWPSHTGGPDLSSPGLCGMYKRGVAE
jgi:hypothetical protein